MRTLRTAALRDEAGQALPEYSLIIALVSVIVIGALLALSGRIAQVFQVIVDAFR